MLNWTVRRPGHWSPICSATRSSAAAPTSTRCSTSRPPTTAGPARCVWLGVPDLPEDHTMDGRDRCGNRKRQSPLRLLASAVGAATSDRVEILQNDITYAAAVVAIDASGNPSEPVIGFGTPVKTLSFYDVYRDQTPQGRRHRRLLRDLDGPPGREDDRRRSLAARGGRVRRRAHATPEETPVKQLLARGGFAAATLFDRAGRGATRCARAGLRAGSVASSRERPTTATSRRSGSPSS